MIWLRWTAAILLCGWLGQYAVAMLVPHIVMERLYNRIGNTTDYNQLYVNPRPDHTFRNVVRPSPDLIYAFCVYNLEQGPLQISAPVPERYWSMQFYQMNTDNFAGINNQREQRFRVGTEVSVTLIGPNDNPAKYPGEVIQSPTSRGMMLLRASGIGGDAQAQTALKNSRCSAQQNPQTS